MVLNEVVMRRQAVWGVRETSESCRAAMANLTVIHTKKARIKIVWMTEGIEVNISRPVVW